MSNIDKHAVQEVADLKAGYTLGHADVAILNELARIALASLEADAVGEVVQGEYDDCGCYPDARAVCIAADGQADWENFKDGTRLYTAPPAQLSVPDFDTLRLLFEASERESDHGFNLHKYGIGYADEATQARWEAWVACRAAMLQGAEPVTTDYKLPPHIYRELVNRLRDTAVKYQGCQQLREQLSRTLQEVIQPAAPQQEE